MKAIKNIRLKDYDYSSDGFYFVTVCTNYGKHCLVGKNKMIIDRYIKQLPQKIKGVKIDYCQIMSSHIHLILVLEGCKLKLGEIVRRLKAATGRQVGFVLWQPNYYEHMIRNEEALFKIREYI